MSSNLKSLPLPASSFSGSGRSGKYFLNLNGSIVTLTASYLTVALFTTFINKLLFTNSEYKFPYPLFTVLFQLVITFIFMTLWSIIKPFPHLFAPAKFQWNSILAKHIGPLTITYICIIVFNSSFLKYVETTTYHFAHSLSIVFSILFSRSMLQTEIPRHVQSAAIIIIFGISTGSMGYLNFSLAGFFYTLAWPALVALYGIYLKKTLIYLKNDIWCLLQYNTVMSIAVMAPIVLLSGELNEIFSTVWFWDEFGFWLQMIITALIGLGLNTITLIFLMNTSPLSLTIAGVLKTVIQSFTAVLLFGNRMTLLNILGFLIALAGCCYTIFTNSRLIKNNF
ncbi:MAG: hypothetical protein EXX96DRAFT_561192 [Benjaminiella poitrasii]|nr:MAG: hypothetical protein EXX96DRAFT_561192 [Benjaminiella poitrasii]